MAHLGLQWWTGVFDRDAPRQARRAILERQISQGRITERAENELGKLVGSNSAVLTSSGSTALMLSMLAAGVVPGSRIGLPAYGWIAAANAAHLLGCKIELFDIETSRPVVSAVEMERANEAKIDFFIPIHMNGHATDGVDCLRDNIVVIEDAAQALGSRNEQGLLGTLGLAGCFSFSGAKIISSGQGGAVVSSNPAFVEDARRMRTQGLHSVFAPEVWGTAGLNFRYNDVLASILLTQLPRLDARLSQAYRLREAYERSLEKLDGLKLIRHKSNTQVGPYIELWVGNGMRNSLMGFLAARGIECRPAYPPITSALYLNFANAREFPRALEWSKSVMYLPCGPGLSVRKALDVAGEIAEWHSTC